MIYFIGQACFKNNKNKHEIGTVINPKGDCEMNG